MSVLRDKGGFLSPVISLVDHEGRPAVLKDYRPRNSVTRTLLAPVLVRREFELLRHLEGLPGIPRAFAVVEGRALMLEYIEGEDLGKFRPGTLPDATLKQLAETIRAMHERGVAHLDLRQRKNILIASKDQRPWLIDFTNSVLVRPRSPLRPLFGKLRDIDESALLKFKARTWPHLLTAADKEALKHQRFLRRFWPFSPHTDRPGDLEGRQ